MFKDLMWIVGGGLAVRAVNNAVNGYGRDYQPVSGRIPPNGLSAAQYRSITPIFEVGHVLTHEEELALGGPRPVPELNLLPDRTSPDYWQAYFHCSSAQELADYFEKHPTLLSIIPKRERKGALAAPVPPPA